MGQPKMPAIYISKYNRFVDNIIGRINKILGKSYDPVRVKLHTGENKKKSNGNKKKSKGKGKKKNNNRKSPQRKTPDARNKMGELPIARSTNAITEESKMIESETKEPAFILISKAGSEDFLKNVTVTTIKLRDDSPKQGNKNRRNNATKSGSKTKSGNKTKNTSKSGNKTKNKVKQSNNKTKQSKKKPTPRATLFGLSSIRRDGDVTVTMMSDHTNVKTDFVLGPLTLRVEKETLIAKILYPNVQNRQYVASVDKK